MKRREFIAATAALLVSPRRSWAQGTPRRIGFLGAWADEPARDPVHAAWLSGLREKGWIEGKNLTCRISLCPGSPASLGRRVGGLNSGIDNCFGTASSPSPEIGHRHHSDCIRGCGRSRGAWPRPKPIASRRQHNGACDLRARSFRRNTNRNPPGTGAWRLKNCDPSQSGQPNAQADNSRGDTPHGPRARRGSADS